MYQPAEMKDFWPEDFNLQPFCQYSNPKLENEKGSKLRLLGISRPTYSLTSCSPIARVLVCQPSGGPGFIHGVLFSFNKGNNPSAAANPNHSGLNKISSTLSLYTAFSMTISISS
jgi:hypothetical protein